MLRAGSKFLAYLNQEVRGGCLVGSRWFDVVPERLGPGCGIKTSKSKENRDGVTAIVASRIADTKVSPVGGYPWLLVDVERSGEITRCLPY